LRRRTNRAAAFFIVSSKSTARRLPINIVPWRGRYPMRRRHLFVSPGASAFPWTASERLQRRLALMAD